MAGFCIVTLTLWQSLEYFRATAIVERRQVVAVALALVACATFAAADVALA
jgi:hypothetical protein